MARSRFFPKVCKCLHTSEAVWKMCMDAASVASKELGAGHTERTYESVMADWLYKQRIPTLRQAKYFHKIDTTVHETGIVDLEVDQKVILELKAGVASITEEHKVQVQRYLRSARLKYTKEILIAGVILFDKAGGVKMWRVVSKPK